MSDPLSFLPGATWVVETMRNQEQFLILSQSMSSDGGQRIVIPNKVALTIYRHYESIMAAARKERAKAGAAIRKKKREAQKEL